MSTTKNYEYGSGGHTPDANAVAEPDLAGLAGANSMSYGTRNAGVP